MSTWNPWKVTATAMALVMSTALVTGLVVANWSGSDGKLERVTTETKRDTAQTATTSIAPTPAAIESCNQWAAQHAGSQDKTLEVVKNGGGRALYGLNENRKHDERYRAAYASCMRARGYAV